MKTYSVKSVLFLSSILVYGLSACQSGLKTDAPSITGTSARPNVTITDTDTLYPLNTNYGRPLTAGISPAHVQSLMRDLYANVTGKSQAEQPVIPICR